MELLIQERIDALLDIYRTGPCALSPQPSRIVGLAPGESIVWDECCEGQLTVRLREMTPKFRQNTTGGQLPCAVEYWIATFEITLLRCAATVSNQGTAPTAARLAQDGAQGLADMKKLLAGLYSFGKVKSVVAWNPEGPTGGCFGGTWVFTLWFDGPTC